MPGFWDEYTPAAGGAYLSKDEKARIIERGIEFVVAGITIEEGTQYGDRYVMTVSVDLDDGEGAQDRLLSVAKGSVASRDRDLDALSKYLDDPTATPPECKLVKEGRSMLIRPASSD